LMPALDLTARGAGNHEIEFHHLFDHAISLRAA
jgi:hypothetical protein